MTLVSSLIKSAFRESNMIPVNANATPSQGAEALALLNTIYKSLFGNILGFRLNDWKVATAALIVDPTGFPVDQTAGAYTVTPQARLSCALTAATALNLNPYPQDGERFAVVDAKGNFAASSLTLNGNGNQIELAPTKVLATAFQRAQWFFRADLSNWQAISTQLAATDDIGLPTEYDDFWMIALSMRLNPRYGREIGDQSQARLTQQVNEIKTRYSQTSVRDGNPDQPATSERVQGG